MMQTLRRIHQKGTVLITVMLMVAVAALIASEIAYRQQMDILRTGAFLARDAASWYLGAAEELGLQALRKDREDDDRDFQRNSEIPISDHFGEEWNRGGTFPLPGGIGLVEGKLIDLQSRFNVNSLMDPDPRRRQLYGNVFVAIVGKVLQDHPEAFPDGTTASMLKERVIDWLDEDQNATGFDGMEDDEYFRKERPYRTANHFITDPSELLLIDNFTPQALSLLEDKLAFLPLSAKINLYTASKELLIQLGFSTGEATELADNQRPKKFNDKFSVEYKDLNEVFTFLLGPNKQPGGETGTPGSGTEESSGAGGDESAAGGSGSGTTALQADMFDIKSNYFLLKGKAVVNGKPVLVESVIWKPDLNNNNGAAGGGGASTAQPILPVKVIFRKFVDPLKQTN